MLGPRLWMATGRVRGGLTKNPSRPKMLTVENLHPHTWVENCICTRRVSGAAVLTGRQLSSVRRFRVPVSFGVGFGCPRVLGSKIVVHRAPNGDLRVWIETRTHARCHPGSGAGAPMGVNPDPHPHPTGAKPVGDPPCGCRLPSLASFCAGSLRFLRLSKLLLISELYSALRQRPNCRGSRCIILAQMFDYI
jgi:hypothetical protein